MARFGTGWVLSLLLLSTFPSIEQWVIRGTIGSLSFVLRIPASDLAAPSNILQVGDASWAIVPDCTSLMPTLTLALAMVSFPSGLRWKALGIAAGGAFLWIFNIGRLVLLHVVETWLPQASSIVHVYLFQTLAFLFVCMLFMLWLEIEPRPGRHVRSG